MSAGKTDKNIGLPTGWDVRPLGEVVQPTRPRIKPSEKPNLPFIGMENIEAHTMKLLGIVPAETMKSLAVHFQPDDVLYGRLRPYLNKVYRPDFEGLCSAEFIVFPKTEGINSRYLQHFLNSSSFTSYASHLNTGDRPRVDFEQLSPYPFPVVSYEQQKRIVAEIEKQFSRLDEAVANLKRVKANLKRYKAAVLKAAVEGKLTEEWRKQHPNIEPASKLLERILAERRAKWNGRGEYKEPAKPDTKNLPLLPEKWTWASVDQLTSHITSGSRDWTRYYGRGSGTFILAQNVRLMRLDMSERQSVDPPKSDAETARTRVSIGDLLVTIVGAKTGEVCRIPMELVEHFVCQSVALLRPLMPESAKFMELYLASQENGQAQWKQYIYGQGRPHLSFEQLKMTAIALPSLTEQHQVVAEVERRLSVIEELESTVEANLTRAERLRQSVLRSAFSGGLVDRNKPTTNSDRQLVPTDSVTMSPFKLGSEEEI